MKEFKPLKELVKALTYIGDAIAGTNKSSNSQGESNNVYDGILKVTDGSNEVLFSFGIKDNDNATKLGDLFTDNFINDLNNSENIYFVSTVSKLNNEIIRTRALPRDEVYNDGSVSFIDNYPSFDINIFDNNTEVKVAYRIMSSKPFTKDTPLEKINNDEQEA